MDWKKKMEQGIVTRIEELIKELQTCYYFKNPSKIKILETAMEQIQKLKEDL